MGALPSGSPTSSKAGSFAPMPLPSLVPKDRVFFDLFNQAGQNTLRGARIDCLEFRNLRLCGSILDVRCERREGKVSLEVTKNPDQLEIEVA